MRLSNWILMCIFIEHIKNKPPSAPKRGAKKNYSHTIAVTNNKKFGMIKGFIRSGIVTDLLPRM